MTALAMLHSEVAEFGVRHRLTSHEEPVVGCPVCIPADRAAAAQGMIDVVSITLTDDFRGQDAHDPARRLLAWLDLATYRGLIPPSPFTGTLNAPPTGTVMPCGAGVVHEGHPYVRHYTCEGT